MGNKTFKTLEEQINILQGKGLVINNPDYAKEVLLRENYFFLHGYRHPFVKSSNKEMFIDGTTFEELYSLFLFDREIRNIIFKNILIVENNIKSIFSYQLSKKYGYKEKEYLNPNNFTNAPQRKKQVNDLISKMKRQIKHNAFQHSATMHYANNYGYIPLWVLVKVLSFGIVSELFSILKTEDQNEITNIYSLNTQKFSEFVTLLSNYRNLCAHEDIVYDNKTQLLISNTIYHKELNIPMIDDEYVNGKNDLFAIMIISKSMLKDKEVKLLLQEIGHQIDNLEYNLKTIPVAKVLDRMGFPENWKDLEKIEKKEIF